MPAWHACLTRARSEKKAAERLRGKGITTYLPLVARVSEWKDRNRVVEWPAFPGYVFCRFGSDELTGVLTTAGVARVVRQAGELAVIRDDEMENVRRVIDGVAAAGVEPEPTADFRTGEPVRVVRGPFSGVTGRVREVRGRKRLLVALAQIGQGLEIDISAESLEAWDPAKAVHR